VALVLWTFAALGILEVSYNMAFLDELTQLPSRRSFKVPAPIIAVVTWLIPGSGYFLLGQYARGLTIGITILILFMLGCLIGGIHVVDPPVFTAGRTRATVRLAESVERELVINYERAIYRALRDVSDALAGYHKTGEQRAQQEQLVAALRDATRLSTDRYQGGLDSYLQVLDAQRSLFRSELDLAALQRQELVAIVELYRALGGGWNE